MSVETDIDRLKARLDVARPLTPKSVAAIDAWYDVELTYSSNAIEGNTLTRMETAVILEKGITVAGKPLKDHLEVLGHKDALDYVRQLACKQETIREGDIRAIHQFVLGRTNPADAGQYSSHQRAIAGSDVEFPNPAQIGPLMAEFASWLQASPQTYDTGFEAHYRLVTIHPFSDGNGRTARLLMNLLLMRSGFPPVVIGPEDRVRYLNALETRQLTEDAVPYQSFMKERLRDTLTRYVEHIEKELKARIGGPSPAKPPGFKS